MIEILIESLCTHSEFEKLKELFENLDPSISVGACLEDHLLMVDTNQPLGIICDCLEHSGFHVSGVALLKDQNVQSMAKYHGQCYLH